ncbi:MAG TPA: long-chain fatty acid--CoA ligase [Candidatus Limnocylindria bacterium]|nr:long-chain fatty acid--CoA ligase [Candidatus Limnocylindria bacterium]
MTTEQSATAGQLSWLDHYEENVPAEVDVPAISVDGLLRRTAGAHPERTAMDFFGAKTSFAELDRAADRFAHALHGMGVGKGDRVSLHLPTSPAFVIAFMGALRAGAIAVPMNPLYVERELGVLFEQVAPTVSVTIDLLVPRMDRLREDGTSGQAGRLIVTGIQDSLPLPIKWLYPLKARREGRWNPQRHTDATPNFFRLLRTAPIERFESAALPSDLAVLQPTGGTTGSPKAAMLTHHNLVANACQVAAWFPQAGQGDPPRIICPLPLFHIYGLTVGMNYAMLIGATLILLPRFDPLQVLKAIAKKRPQLFPGAPIMYQTLAQHPQVSKFDLSSIEACISGAAPLPLEVQRDFEQITGGRVCEGYGLTEASPVTHCNPIHGERRNGTIGLPFPSTEARIADPSTHRPLPQGEVGELEIRGPQVMAGYWQRPEETADALSEGWLRTGDIASVDADGYFTIVDRKKDLVIVGGLNVYPREVEEVLVSHPAVREAAVIGAPDTPHGEVPYAFVVPEEGHRPAVDELLEYCRSNLARYKIPRTIEIRQELPKSMIGKVLRKELRAEVLATRQSAPADD